MSTLSDPVVRPAAALADPMERAKSLESIIKAEADRTSEIGQIAEPVVEAIRETELFWMNVPAELGGEDLPMKRRFEIYEEIASYDGSTGWAFMTLSGFVGYTAVGLGDSAVQAMYGDRENRALAAGFAAPTGTATPTGSGYQVSGSYRFGSGAPHADYLAAGAAIEGSDGAGFTAFVPRSEATSLGGWNVFGLKGSGSIDYEVKGSYVEKDFTFDPANYVAHRGGAGGRLDFLSTAVIYHTAIALGVAKHALKEIVRIGDSGRQRPPAPKMIDQQRFLHEFTYKEARLAAARAYLIERVEDARIKIENDTDMTDLDRARLRQAANTAHTAALETTQWAYGWGGTSSFRDGSVLGRCLLDVEVAILHAHVDHSNLDDIAPTILDSYRLK
jgi:alkylation response protein AidB-like acyl-CoA dehydrogenase